jgi:hypothetical protein
MTFRINKDICLGRGKLINDGTAKFGINILRGYHRGLPSMNGDRRGLMISRESAFERGLE